ncbi:hypothetical protein RIVERRIDER_86 [Xanthomonas phage RiverRider]|uniref:Tail fiber protein n=1 Tax=Xanthomonas phage RiverRider TaxID=2108116 RepID=A0A2P1JUX7_9CAUD|nr:tail fiber protein [Xanthomonas phage RiverRider]AVO23167.1 hypothetical protein RIVERRIDER_86 [Xanthomonas phage RiverRider]
MTTWIYQRPVGTQKVKTYLPLYVVGKLPDYESNKDYEGRLQLINAIGPSKARQIGGSVLPSTTRFIVDEETQEVVVTWKRVRTAGEYETPPAVIRNAGFEESSKFWQYGLGWDRSTENALTGSYSGRFSTERGTSKIISTSRFRVKQGKAINASCDVRQGASAAGNAGAAVILQWYDADGNELSLSQGNAVMSASKNKVYPSRVTAVPPEGAVEVAIGAVGSRVRENKNVWLDNFVWDHLVYPEINELPPEGDLDLILEVTDSTGRTAIWQGMISEDGVSVTSQLYPFYQWEDFQNIPAVANLRSQPGNFKNTEAFQQNPSLMFEINNVRKKLDAGYEEITHDPSVANFDIRTVKKSTSDSASITNTPAMASFEIKKTPRINLTTDSITTIPSVTWSYG